ncbi:MAG: type 1 glutamine amidotransferase [Betaproteobacteria bacterium]
MKPVLVLQHLPDDGPAFLATWLAAQGRAVDLRHTAAGDDYPERIDGFGALAVLGGEWGANDDRPSLRRAELLIRQAVAAGVPVLGHCLGGQLMARALGAPVAASAAPQRGWPPVRRRDTPVSHAWFGAGQGEPVLFQWHRDAFGLPPGAESLAHSPACPHQAFALGPHLAMQFHVEVDEAKLRAWAAEAESEPAAGAASAAPTWHDAAALRAGTQRHLAASQALAGRVYARWLRFAV